MTMIAPRPRAARAVLDPAPRGDYNALRTLFGRFPSGVAALCAIIDGERVGMVASSFTVGASFEPPMVMFAVQNSSTTWPRLRGAERIGISVLGTGHEAACMRLSSRRGDRFEGVEVHGTPTGALFLDAAPLWLECVVRSESPAGDHHVVVLEVERLRGQAARDPLVYHGARFRSLAAEQPAA